MSLKLVLLESVLPTKLLSLFSDFSGSGVYNDFCFSSASDSSSQITELALHRDETEAYLIPNLPSKLQLALFLPILGIFVCLWQQQQSGNGCFIHLFGNMHSSTETTSFFVRRPNLRDLSKKSQKTDASLSLLYIKTSIVH